MTFVSSFDLVQIGAVTINLFRASQSLYLRHVTDRFLERYGVSASWKAYSKSLVLFLHYGRRNQSTPLEDIQEMLDAAFEPHMRRFRVHPIDEEQAFKKR